MQSALTVCGWTSRRREAWACCSLDHRVGSPRQSEPYHHCDQSHQLSKLLHKKIDDIIFQILISFLPMASFLIMLTCLQWNLLIAVAIHSFQIGNILDPVLDLCYPRIDTMARTLAAIAHNSNLGKSEINEHFVIHKITTPTFHSLVPSVGHQSLLGTYPCHWNQHKYGTYKLN